MARMTKKIFVIVYFLVFCILNVISNSSHWARSGCNVSNGLAVAVSVPITYEDSITKEVTTSQLCILYQELLYWKDVSESFIKNNLNAGIEDPNYDNHLNKINEFIEGQLINMGYL